MQSAMVGSYFFGLVEKTRMVWLPLMSCLAGSTQDRRVTDGRTDGQTSWHSIVRAMHTHCAVKMFARVKGIRYVFGRFAGGTEVYIESNGSAVPDRSSCSVLGRCICDHRS